MSNSNSSVYKRSSFDAIESTRKLSEEISSNQHSNRQNSAIKGKLKEYEKNDYAITDNNFIQQADDVRKVTTVQAITAFDYDKNNNSFEHEEITKFVNVFEEDEKTEQTEIPEKFFGADVQSDPLTKQRANNNESEFEDHGRAKARGQTGVRTVDNADMFEQRSVSDSDLDSPDDFSDGQLSHTSQYEENEKDLVADRRESQDVYIDKKSGCVTNNNGALQMVPENNQQTQQADDTSAPYSNVKGDSMNPATEGTRELPSKTDPLSNDSHHEQPLIKAPEYGQLTEAEIDNKLKDDDVIRQGEILDTVREVGLTNLNKLQHLNWDDPTVKRLFMKPRISVMEVKSVKVDPDIKNMVNEFLKTNVAENFVISRVLRENYAVFYSWLATHLQTERNSWTTRLAQALDQADQERKASLQTRDLVVEAAARLRKLVKTSSNILFGIPNKDDEMFFKVDTFRRQGRKDMNVLKGPMNRSQVHNFPSDGGYMSDGNAGILRRSNKFRLKNTSRAKKDDLVPSNYRLVKVTDDNCEKVNYDSDPGETSGNRCFIDDSIDDNESSTKQYDKSLPKSSNKVNDKNNGPNKKFSKEVAEKGLCQTKVLYSGYDLDGYIIDDDKFTDWNQVLVDNIEVLTDICDTLLVDRKSCLQMLKANPRKCESLTEAVSDFASKRHVEMNNKRDIEKRLRTLEIENRSLQEEMSMLQKTLADKNRDALNLQSQLDRLETMMQNHSVPKLHKCVGTSEEMFPAVFKNNLTVGGNRTPRQSNHNLSKVTKATTQSPRPKEKEIKSKVVELPNLNGISNVKHPRQKHEFHSPVLSGTRQEEEGTPNHEVTNPNSLTVPESTYTQQPSLVREPSLIEISEEKLKTLKHRARKLEDSLHDAISSMDKFNKSTQQSTGSLVSSNGFPSIGPFHSDNKSRLERNVPKTFRSWQKASFEVSNRALDSNASPTPRVAVIRRSNSFSKQYDCKEQTVSDIQITLNTEHSSILEGRSIPNSSRDAVDPMPTTSSLRTTSDKTPALIMQSSRSTFDPDTSDDEKPSHDNEVIHTYRRSNDTASNVSSQKKGSKTRRQRARHNTSRLLAGKQAVSKCLRCQKLFSPTDNHKLACCYHTKDKERLEHYDQSGMLIRVMYAWKCCHEPQESEGCCYGQHV